MAAGMEAQNDFCARRPFDAQTLCADWNAAIGADLNRGANTPNIRPPGATRGRAQDGALFFLCQFPGLLWNHAQLAMAFLGIAMEAQRVDV